MAGQFHKSLDKLVRLSQSEDLENSGCRDYGNIVLLTYTFSLTFLYRISLYSIMIESDSVSQAGRPPILLSG